MHHLTHWRGYCRGKRRNSQCACPVCQANTYLFTLLKSQVQFVEVTSSRSLYWEVADS